MSSYGPQSQSADPYTTSADSPDTLPTMGYSVDALAAYIMRQLGAPTWNVELTKQQVLDCIQDALGLYSQWVPLERVGNIVLVRGQFRYLEGVDVGQGISKVEFVEATPLAQEVFFFPGSQLNPAPLIRLGLDEYDTFLRWRKTWCRVTSVIPDWYYDEAEQTLYIHNPIERYSCAVFYLSNYTRTQGLNMTGAQWVKEYALEKARYLLGEVWSKFSGAIPGPLQNLQLDQGKREKAEAALQKLRDKLQGMQKSAGISID